jgi:hypothetical protein
MLVGSPWWLRNAAVTRAMTATSLASNTASNSAALLRKWWYRAPLVTRARAVTSSREVPAKPRSANNDMALSINA